MMFSNVEAIFEILINIGILKLVSSSKPRIVINIHEDMKKYSNLITSER